MPGASSGAGAGLRDRRADMPPISACDELDGMPYHQVMQVPGDGADQRAEDHVVVDDAGIDDALADRRRDAQVEDEDRDEVEEGRPQRPPAAACSTPVDTTVAMEFAASWKPFMKSNASASATSSTTTPKRHAPSSMRSRAARAQAFSSTTPSITLATSSHWSVVDSSSS